MPTTLQTASTETEGHFIDRVPATAFFLTSAVFHYLGPSLAVLLFDHVAALGVMWLRIATAGVVFAVWRRPWRFVRTLDRRQLALVAALGLVLAVMNSVFYLAVARLPLATVGAIEFLGTVVLATLGVRTWRNLTALAVTVGGVAMLTAVKIGSDPIGFLFAFANCAGFMAYVVLGHRFATRDRTGAATPGRRGIAGIDQLAAAMLVATVIATPAGAIDASRAFGHPTWLLWGAGVGVCSSVIPYVTDQLAMARMPRATFSLMLALLPACATAMGAIVLRQIPTVEELCGIGLVVLGLVVHVAPVESGGAGISGGQAGVQRDEFGVGQAVAEQIAGHRQGLDRGGQRCLDGGAVAREDFGHRGELVTDAEFVVALLHPVVAQQVVGDDLLRCRSGQGEQHEGEQTGAVLAASAVEHHASRRGGGDRADGGDHPPRVLSQHRREVQRRGQAVDL